LKSKFLQTTVGQIEDHHNKHINHLGSILLMKKLRNIKQKTENIRKIKNIKHAIN